MFLLDSQEIDLKEKKFRDIINDDDSWFVDYVIGEYYFKTGNSKKDLEFFNSSTLQASLITNKDKRPEEWISERIENRLRQLR